MKHIMKFPLDTGKKEQQEYDLLFPSLHKVGPSNLKSWKVLTTFLSVVSFSAIYEKLDLGYMGQDMDAIYHTQAKLKRSETGNIMKEVKGFFVTRFAPLQTERQTVTIETSIE